MRAIRLVMICVCILICSNLAVNAKVYTLTFDEFKSGTSLLQTFYRDGYSAYFDSGFKAQDHTTSTWGFPHSGSNVMIWNGDLSNPLANVYLGLNPTPSTHGYDVCSIGAYFSTQPGIMVRLTTYYHNRDDNTDTQVTSIVLGDSNDAWENQYVTIDSSNGVFNWLKFEGVNSTNDLLGFCADDMAVTPVPEPSSLLALGFTLLPVGIGVMRRKLRR